MTPTDSDDPGGSHVARGAPRDVIDIEWWSPEGSLGGLVRVDTRAGHGRTSFLAAVVGPGRVPVVVIDHDLPAPAVTWELRASGIWTDLTREVALDHWTVGLEAFGLAVDPAEVVTPATFGDRVPVGLDLDLDTVAAPIGDERRFAIELRVHGVVLVGDEAFDLDGGGVRRRRWDGAEPELRTMAGTPLASVAVGWPTLDGGEESVVRRHLARDDDDVGWVAEGQCVAV